MKRINLEKKFLEKFFKKRELKSLSTKEAFLILKKKYFSIYEIYDLWKYFYKNGSDLTLNKLFSIFFYFKKKGLNPLLKIIIDPYSITEIDGFGLKTAEEILKPFNIERSLKAQAVVYYLLNKALDNGHTAVTENFLKTIEENDLEIKEIKKALNELKKNEIAKELDGFYGLKKAYEAEKKIFEEIDLRQKKKFNEPLNINIEKYEKIEKIKFSEKQKKFLTSVLKFDKSIYFLIGYAGTGKTTLLRTLIRIFNDHLKEKSIIICAFTAMAARRAQEVTSHKAKTIHSLLKYKNKKFYYNENNKLPYDIIILDEASTVDSFLFLNLLRALKEDSLFICVGDPAQLPPVGPGQPFRDIIESKKYDFIELNEIFRQKDEGIIYVADHVRKMKYDKNIFIKNYKDYEFIEKEKYNVFAIKKKYKKNQKKIKEKLKENSILIYETIEKIIKTLIDNQEITDQKVQVLTAMKNGLLGTENLNRMLQLIFNSKAKPTLEIKNKLYRLDDRVVNLINHDRYVMKYEIFKNEKKYIPLYQCRILNGQIGKIIHVNKEKKKLLIYFENDSLVAEYKKDEILKYLDLAYALTVHKFQGSQTDYIIIPISTSQWYLLNNQWLYTAITRARKKLYLIGQTYALKHCINQKSKEERSSFLKLFLSFL